jgi:hypothetical protein
VFVEHITTSEEKDRFTSGNDDPFENSMFGKKQTFVCLEMSIN